MACSGREGRRSTSTSSRRRTRTRRTSSRSGSRRSPRTRRTTWSSPSATTGSTRSISSAESDAPDLVGISVNSKTAARAYAIADAYRARGSLVVLGGIHVTALPDEAARARRRGGERRGRVDLAGRGARRAGRQARARRARCSGARSTSTTTTGRLVGLPQPRRDLIKSHAATSRSTSCRPRAAARSRASSAASRPTTGRSSASARCRRSIAELETCGPRILFGDDNVMIHTKYSHELFEAMVPLEKHWVGQASLAALHRVENVAVMARSGCRALFIGFESVDDDAVRGAGKKQNKPQQVPRGRRAACPTTASASGAASSSASTTTRRTPSSARSSSASRPRSRWRSSRCSRPTPARPSTSA